MKCNKCDEQLSDMVTGETCSLKHCPRCRAKLETTYYEMLEVVEGKKRRGDNMETIQHAAILWDKL